MKSSSFFWAATVFGVWAGVLLEGAASGQVAPLPRFAQGARAVSGIELIRNGDFAASLNGNWNAAGASVPALEVVPAPGEEFYRALKLTVAPLALSKPWDSRLGQTVHLPVKRGDVIYIRAWMRSPQSAPVGLVYQMASEPYTQVAARTFYLSPRWAQLQFFGVAGRDFAPGESVFEFHLGQTKATFEVAGVRVEDYGPNPPADLKVTPIDYWNGQKHDDTWKKAALERIEKIRKADISIRVVDEGGQPIQGARVQLAQARQAFRWGSAVVAARLNDHQNPDDLRYQAEVARLFNTVVFENDLKWNSTNPETTAQVQQAMKWLQSRDIAVRGHNLVWGARQYLPADVSALWDDPEKLRAALRTHVREQVAAYKGQVYVWDVVNEAATNTELWEKLGWDEFAQVFKMAREVDSNVRLSYNDFNISNESQNPPQMQAQRRKVAELIEFLKKQGAPVDLYGDQAHFGAPLTPPSRMIEIWNEVAKLGLPIEITEFDASIPDDQVHGEYVRDTLIAAFSQPEIQSFIIWGFWEGAHWRAAEGGAMFRLDWSQRPAQETYEKLILGEWMTHENLKTNEKGRVQTRGFLGDYNVTVEAGGKSVTVQMKLTKAGAKTQIVL
ncbi:Endo-1,4-beta-xylanase, GH35 family [Abditibacterium utsteinense]|uniref:Beta-xylanase n=1 Tax=Abditibacterium utsteinense TaxID=1960156 RepID=A0A2S8SU00_9BACT|nr:endo-1,4-beta-xylanase [Abditibacterium utsteinense]PQV64284.1 Endo-1,4-beta-xylanase, GH35 family [Abditibacterium utsteinense]